MANSFGRGAMTNHWIDIKNADVIMIIGSNAAENHPISFRWVEKAIEERGATLIVVDPRFTRSAAKAHIYAPIRVGTDIAFMGGLINYVLEKGAYNHHYVALHTNASFIIDDAFDFDPEEGLFSGFIKQGEYKGVRFGRYDKKKGGWGYKLGPDGQPLRDLSLKHPRCVFQLLKRHFARYSPEMVEKITGCPRDIFLKVAEKVASCGQANRVMTIMYAMGATQHTYGTQNIRSYVILQLLLGNIGLAGGGINALRGESNVQGSTDMCLLFHILPGYLKTPRETMVDLKTYIRSCAPKPALKTAVNYWKNYPKFIVSLLKAWWGPAATRDNDFCYQYLPKLDSGENYSHIMLFEAMYSGLMEGAFMWGQNMAVGGPNANKERRALEKLKWMVSVDLWVTETAEFWRRPGVDPSQIQTEVFFLPAAASFEKEGSITNSGRWVQWRYQAVEPPGEAKPDTDIINLLFRKIRELYEKEGGTFPDPILKLHWPYGIKVDSKVVLAEINGYEVASGRRLANFTKLREDGSTACGNWLYSGVYPPEGNLAARREHFDPTGIGLYPRFSWCWPLNRRILYNRASCDDRGRPWCPDRPVIWWTGDRWMGDVPDYGRKVPPEKIQSTGAFIMLNEGYGRLFAAGLKDGPFPEFYEPVESRIKNPLSRQQFNPAISLTARILDGPMNKVGTSKEYPYLALTYRVCEHWQAGAMTRNLPYLCELMPEMFAEIPVELAQRLGIGNGDRVRIRSARGNIEAVAIVTERMMPLVVNGEKVYQIGIPWHWGYKGLSTGDSGNELTIHAGDANTMIPEFKGFLVDLEKV